MRPYRNYRLSETPDVHDIQTEGRRTAVGGKKRGYMKNKASKAVSRRSLKRSDKGKFRLDSEI